MITVLGAKGFIGSGITDLLKQNKHDFYAPERNENLFDKDLGDIIYCIGLTADFRTKPFETVEAHVTKLTRLLKDGSFNSLTYLSSARVYINCKTSGVNEETVIPINPMDPDELYTLTKLTGERICLSSGRKVKIVRLSNVYGNNDSSENFLKDVITNILRDKKVSFRVLPSSAKDYISISDAANMIIKVALEGKSEIYNVASGFNTSNSQIINALKKQMSFDTDFTQAVKSVVFPRINIEKITDEFNFTPENIITFIPHLINSYNNVSH